MDTKQRHDLKSNELADWLSDLPGYLRENSGKIIGIILIAAGIISWPILGKMRQQNQLTEQIQTTALLETLDQGKYQSLQNNDQEASAVSALLVAANSLQDRAKEIKNPDWAALALIKQAQGLRADLHYKKQIVTPELVHAQIAQAQQAYQQAAEKAKNANIAAMAQLGLGLCAEELGQTAQARTIYGRITANEKFAGCAIQVQARLRLEEMADNTEKFTFVEPPVQEKPQDLNLQKQAAAEPAEQTAATEQAPTDAKPAPDTTKTE